MWSLFTWLGGEKSANPRIDQTKIENVCFKGGGMKGHAFIGVDRALTELKLWGQVKRFIGSSAGAIFAGAAACRIPYAVMASEIEATDFSKFKDSYWGRIGEGYRIYEDMGMFEGKYFYNWYRNLLKKHVGDGDITFQQVYARFGSELVITTTDVTKKRLVYMDRHSNPDLKLCDAVRRSMSIPAFYVPVKEIDENGMVHVYVDGGCTNNFPLAYFDNLYSSREEAFSKTIGFNLSADPENTDPSQYTDRTAPVNNIIDLITALINTDIEVIERLRLHPDDQYRTVTIPTFDYDGTDFDMSKEDINKLSQSGYSATMKFFKSC